MTVGTSGGERNPVGADDAGRPPRRYESPRRRAGAEATRAAIGAAARRLFAECGWSGTTIRGVARAAGVSEPTVYAVYRSKAGLASALVDAVAATADPQRQDTDLLVSRGDPAGQLAAMVAFDRRLYEDGGDVLAALRDAGRSEPDLDAADRAGRAAADQVRRRVLADWPRAALRDGLDHVQAVDTYAAVCNIDVYRVLTTERGWSPDRVETWLHQSLCLLLLA